MSVTPEQTKQDLYLAIGLFAKLLCAIEDREFAKARKAREQLAELGWVVKFRKSKP